MEEEAQKENRVASTPKPVGRSRKKSALQNVSNLLPPPVTNSLEEELEAVRVRLQKLNMEKEKTDKLLEERDALLKEKEAELQLKAKAQEKLQLELKKLQKLKGFNPVMSFPLGQSLRMSELAKEEEKKKKKKDPNRPKKPSPAYILWCQEQWNQVKSENPNPVFKDMGAILGAKWKTLSAEEKKPYEEKYEAEKEAYLQVVGQERRETEALKLLHDEQKQKTALELLEQYLQYQKDAEGKEKSKRKEKDPSKPKHPVTAFFAFTNERRAALLEENHNVLQIAKILGEEWKNMTKEERAPYEQIAAEAKEKYMGEMELYKQKKAEEASSASKEEEELRKLEREQGLQLLRKKEKNETLKRTMKKKLIQKKQLKEKNSDPNRPKKPPTSFLLFSKETRKKLVQERPGVNNTTINALISLKWKDLGTAEKQKWVDEAAGAMVQYKKEVEEYNKLHVKEQQEEQTHISFEHDEMKLDRSLPVPTTN
uniref:HMG box domain-containing protein n=1 Tax=Picea sitchensis TaxID=3332 RepID=D5ACA0_PICSI|nr:unknown [Picea sitchensis]